MDGGEKENTHREADHGGVWGEERALEKPRTGQREAPPWEMRASPRRASVVPSRLAAIWLQDFQIKQPPSSRFSSKRCWPTAGGRAVV